MFIQSWDWFHVNLEQRKSEQGLKSEIQVQGLEQEPKCEKLVQGLEQQPKCEKQLQGFEQELELYGSSEEQERENFD